MSRWMETPGGVAAALNRCDDLQRRRAGEMKTYLVQVTYEYIETYEVFESDEQAARLSHRAGLSEHISSSPPVERRVRVIAREESKV